MPKRPWLPFTLESDRRLGPPATSASSAADEAHAEAIRLLTTEGDDGDPNEAIRLLEIAAGEGHHPSQLLLGRVLLGLEGKGASALRWLETAAAAGAWEADYLLGIARFRGIAGAPDEAEGRRLHIIAAEHGVPDAQFELSLLLDQGLGGPADPEGARRWERRAADAGHPRACLNLASRFARAEPPDLPAAMDWYRRAADSGSAEAAARLCQMYLHGQGAPRDEAIARTWFDRAAALGYSWKRNEEG